MGNETDVYFPKNPSNITECPKETYICACVCVCVHIYTHIWICVHIYLVTGQTRGEGGSILLRNEPLLLPGSPCTRFTLPASRELQLSVPGIGEKGRNYLLKSYTDLKSYDLMSSLKSQSPLNTHTHIQSFLTPFAQSIVLYLRDRNRSL